MDDKVGPAGTSGLPSHLLRNALEVMELELEATDTPGPPSETFPSGCTRGFS